MYSSLVSDNTITVTFEDGTIKSIHRTHLQADVILNALRLHFNDDDLKATFSKIEALRRYMYGNIVVNEDGEATYKGRPLAHSVLNKILEFMKAGLPYEPLVAFLDRLLENPSFHSVTQLYEFLVHEDITIDAQGFLVCYKAVRSDYMDKHSGRFSNLPGEAPCEDRNQVDDNPDAPCSRGLHVGSIKYVRGFADHGSDRIIMVRVNPKDVVSVPRDYSAQKMRVCTYTVLEDVTDKVITDRAASPLYGAPGDSRDLVNADNNGTCPNCGHALESAGGCSHCGDGDAVCDYCDSILDENGVCDNCNGDGTITTTVNGIILTKPLDGEIHISKDAQGRLNIVVGE